MNIEQKYKVVLMGGADINKVIQRGLTEQNARNLAEISNKKYIDAYPVPGMCVRYWALPDIGWPFLDRIEIDEMVSKIMIYDGPDGHIDGCGVITDFILALLEGNAEEWKCNYLKNKEE